MTGTVEGGVKAALTNKQREPGFYKRIGRIGGKKAHEGKNLNGFAKMTPEQRKLYGQKGGRISKRPARKITVE